MHTAKKMEESEESMLLGLIGGKFHFKRLPDGSLEKKLGFVQTVQKGVGIPPKHFNLTPPSKCKAVSAETVGAVGASSSSTNKRCQQPKHDEMTVLRTKISKSTQDKLRNSLAKWIARDCRLLSVVGGWKMCYRFR